MLSVPGYKKTEKYKGVRLAIRHYSDHNIKQMMLDYNNCSKAILWESYSQVRGQVFHKVGVWFFMVFALIVSHFG